MARRALFQTLSAAMLIVLFAGCSSAQKRRIPSNPDHVIKGEVSEETTRHALEMKLTKQIQFLEQNKEKFKKQVASIPSGYIEYHYKYYDEFPEGPENLDIKITPLDTFVPSYKGEAKYRKIRFQTRFTKSKRRAARDKDFIRDEGVQKEIYEFDGSKWLLKSSIFEVRKTSIYGEDKWRAAHGRIRRAE